MDTNGILSLTIDYQGKLTVWESATAAMAGKKPHEQVIQLSLTAEQMRTVLRARAVAQEKYYG